MSSKRLQNSSLIKKWLVLDIFIFFISVFISTYPTNVNATENASDKPYKIKAVVIKYFPPLYSVDDEGKPQGYAIDLLAAITKIGNIEVEYIVKENWSQVFDTLKEGKADIIPNLGIIKSRQVIFDFSSVIEILPISIFIRDDTNNINSIQDFSGKKIGVVNLNVGEKIAKKIDNIQTTVYAQPEHALIGLLTGNVDAVIYPKPVMRKYIRDGNLEQRIRNIEKPIKEIKRAIAIHKGNKELAVKLNEAINIFLRSEEYNIIYTKWYGKEKPFWNVRNVVVLAFIITFIIAMFFVVWRYESINKINKRLKSLIEDNKKTEGELDKTSVLLKKVASRVPGMVYQFESNADGSLAFPYVSEGVKDIYDMSIEEITENVERVFEVIHPDDLEMVISSIEESARTLLPWKLEYRVRYSDGTVRWLYGNSVPERKEDGGTLWHGFITDITEIKNTEESLIQANLIIKNSPVVVFQWGIQEGWPVEFVSDNVSHFGYEAEDLLSGKIPFSSMVHPDDLERVAQEVEMHSKMGPDVFQQEYRIVSPDGKVFYTDDRTMIERDEHGNITHYQGTILDVSERKNIEEQLRRSQKMDALGKLTGGIAHDYNNMLGVIMGYSELLDGLLSEQPVLKKYAQEIYHAGERGAKLTKKLLSFSRKENLESISLNINRVLEDEKNLLEKTLTSRIELKYVLDEELCSVYMDESDFEDAILNLSINAMHSIEDTGNFTIKTENKSINLVDGQRLKLRAGKYVLVSLIDTGYGMSEEIISKIFDPFFTTKGDSGTGLGLSQVYAFIQRSKGSIEVVSNINVGTEIKLYFPCYFEGDNKQREISNKNVVLPKGHETILIVDDEEALLQLSENILRDHGYHAISASSAKIALEILNAEKVDLVLSDVIMPGMNGFELASLVQEKYPTIKIQLVSGFTDELHLKTKDNVLHKNLIHKPFSSEELLSEIRTLLDS